MNRDVNFSGIRFFEEWRWSSCCSLTFYCKLFCTNWTVLTGWDFFLVFCLRQITHALSRDFKKGGNEIKLLILNLREIYTIVKNFFLKVSILDSRSDSLSNSSFLFFFPPPPFFWDEIITRRRNSLKEFAFKKKFFVFSTLASLKFFPSTYK